MRMCCDLLEEELKHLVGDLLRTGAVYLVHLLSIRVVRVQSTELQWKNLICRLSEQSK